LAACSGDSVGNVYVADRENYTIRKVTADGVVTTLAGQPGSSGSNDGTVKLWHLATGREVYGFTLPFTDLFTMAWLMFSNDGKNLMAGRYDGSRSADEYLVHILRAPSLAEIEAEEKAAGGAR
jgi:WD40 repeat protein